MFIESCVAAKLTEKEEWIIYGRQEQKYIVYDLQTQKTIRELEINADCIILL